MTARLTRDMRYVEVTDEYVHRGRKNTRVGKFLDVTSNAKYFPGVIAVESTKKCRAVSRNFVYLKRIEQGKSAQLYPAFYPKLTRTLMHYVDRK